MISGDKTEALIAILKENFPINTGTMLGRSLMQFSRNLVFAVIKHLVEGGDVRVNVPTSKLTESELNQLELEFVSQGWAIKERDRDHYVVAPGKAKTDTEQLIMIGKWCPVCQCPTVLKDGYYECPQCCARVECHPGTTAAMGYVAGPVLRKKRQQVHAEMDLLWQQNKLARKEIYAKLRQSMNMTKARCHVAKFDEKQCEEAMKIIAKLREDIKNGQK